MEKEMHKNAIVDTLMDVIDEVADKVDLNGFASKVRMFSTRLILMKN